MRAVVVMPSTKERPSRTYVGCTCSMSVSEALEFDLPVRAGPAGPDDGGTVHCDFSMLPNELGRHRGRPGVDGGGAPRGRQRIPLGRTGSTSSRTLPTR